MKNSKARAIAFFCLGLFWLIFNINYTCMFVVIILNFLFTTFDASVNIENRT